MPARSPGFLYFDLGNVLLLFDHELACRQMAEVAGITADRVREIVFDSDLEWRYERGDISSREFYEAFCEKSETTPNFDELLLAGSAMFQLNVPMVPLLGHLKAAGYRLGILSNTCEAHWQYVSRGRYKVISQFFEVHALSYELRAMKPEPEIYPAAAKLAGVPADEIFFVDDRLENVEAACSAGFDVVQFTTAFALAAELRQRSMAFNY